MLIKFWLRRWLRDERDLGLPPLFWIKEFSAVLPAFRRTFTAVFDLERLLDTSVMFILGYVILNRLLLNALFCDVSWLFDLLRRRRCCYLC